MFFNVKVVLRISKPAKKAERKWLNEIVKQQLNSRFAARIRQNMKLLKAILRVIKV